MVRSSYLALVGIEIEASRFDSPRTCAIVNSLGIVSSLTLSHIPNNIQRSLRIVILEAGGNSDLLFGIVEEEGMAW
jgi:hypothetical protein